MTTADLIAVMNGGKIQLGTPEDIYDHPQLEFVARFIGASNVIKGVARDDTHIAFAGATLQVVGAKLTSGQSAAVAIRQHDIQLFDAGASRAAECGQGDRDAPGLSRRQPRLHGRGLRWHRIARRRTPTENAVPRAPKSGSLLPPERCRALSR